MKNIRIFAASLVLASFTAAQGGGAAVRSDPLTTAGQGGPVAASAAPRAIMGVTMEAVDEALAEQIGVDEDEAVLIEDVMAGYGAAKAGIKKHDVVVKFEGKGPVSMESIRKALAKKKIGDHVTVTVIRGRETKEFEVELMAAIDGTSQGGAAAAGPTPPRTSEGLGGASATGPRSKGTGNRAGSAEQDAKAAEQSARSLLGQTMQRRESDEQVRAMVGRLREQMREAEADIAKRARELALESKKMADELAKEARGKFEGSTAEDKLKRLAELSREYAEKMRERSDVDMRDALERQRDTLERSMRELEKRLAKLNTTDWGGWSSTAPAPSGAWKPTPASPFSPTHPLAPGKYPTTEPPVGGAAGGAPARGPGVATGPSPSSYYVLGDASAKSLKKVDERLSGIEERLAHIEEMVEKLLSRSTQKNPK